MSRLSTDREERESQLRQWQTELETETTRTVTNAKGEKVTVGQVILGVAGVVIAILLAKWLLLSLLPAVLRLIIRIAFLAAIVYAILWAIGKWTGKKRV
jgi:uncharacterized BrkB/YihY/UPF0761 family membrane protein